jgi:hypothetical protein
MLLACATVSQFSSEQKAEFDKAIEQLNAPEKVNSWLLENLVYDTEKFEASKHVPPREKVDFWNKNLNWPIETYFKKTGVCHDASNFASYVLKKHRYEVEIVTAYYGLGIGAAAHSVCAFRRDERWWVCADTRTRTRKGVRKIAGPFNNLKDVAVYASDPPESFKEYDLQNRRRGW